jgi:hypothetical protein
LKNLDRHFNCFFFVPVTIIFLELLFKLGHCFLLLLTSCDCTVAN